MDPDSRVQALIEMIKAGDDSALPEVLRSVTSEDPVVRSEAARAAGYLGVNHIFEVGPVLLELLADADEMVRNEAVESLGLVKYAPASSKLVRIILEDSSWLVRASAAEALGSYPGHESVQTLERVIGNDDEYDEVRAYAANTLGRYGDAEVLPALNSMISDITDDPMLTSALRLAAYRLGGQEHLSWVLEYLVRADQAETARLLNDLSELAHAPTPPTLDSDAARIRSALTTAAERWPLYNRQISGMLNDFS
ncbi:HEAT repeat domain-containing protein [Nocardia sp. NEAU-G5]|uniref:HEAT repeat domain-containing protein n=1 Tax=Nocardia albiluteola TaxID=2842303 RepID=A0ABS6AVD1_9NOCA|nr:HEAT repeat domain-containing protein [Nocardia albiluteola]MBU3060925.1 HEAT repeat domain-containing protein [Nocardia albiluteola]